MPIISDYDLQVLMDGKFVARLRTAYNLKVVERISRQLHGTRVMQTEGNVIKVTVRY